MSTQKAEATAGVPTDTLPLRLAIARFAAGQLTAEAAGKLVGKTGTTWGNWERGRHAPDDAMLAYIARQLGCDEAWLREGGPLGTAGSGPSGGEEAPAVGLEPTAVRLTVPDKGPLDWLARRERRSRPRPRRLVLPVELAA